MKNKLRIQDFRYIKRTIRIPEEMYFFLSDEAEKVMGSINSQILIAIREYMKNKPIK